MKASDFLRNFTQTPDAQQIRFLAQLAAEITVWARDTYEAGTDAVLQPERLRMFNEFEHQVTGQLIKLVQRNNERYPADVFAEILRGWAQDLGCTRGLLRVFEESQSAAPVRASA